MIAPVSKGTIKIVASSNPLQNKIVLNVSWFEKDYTDSESYSHVYDIKENQWKEILERDLVGKEVEFDVLDEPLNLIKITFPAIPYTEMEVENLIFKTWEKLKPFHYNEPGMEDFNAWWDSIKKTK